MNQPEEDEPKSEIELHRYWQDITRECNAMRKQKSPSTTKRKFTEKLIDLELSYWPAVDEMIQTRDSSVKNLETKCSEEIELAVSQLGQAHTEASISSLSSRYCQDIGKLQSNWNMSIDALQDAQREDFCEKLNALWEELKSSEHEVTSVSNTLESRLVDSDSRTADTNGHKRSDGRPRIAFNFLSKPTPMEEPINDSTNTIKMEESFTINLGSQLKTAHNIRILAADPMSLCDNHCNRSPQVRIQTAMSLYSHNLSAVVLLSEEYTTNFSGLQGDLLALCSSMNEFHFEDFKKQCKYIKDKVIPAYRDNKYLEMGDCYITRHSNLASNHIVFHLVSDDSIRKDELNSRHPIMAGLRNILRVAHIYDIKTISIPLLLLDKMNEEYLTINWCLKRAELVLKCVKGFLIEMASLSTGVEQGTIQFLVPRHISEDLFASLAALIPEVFRLANSVNLKTAT